MHSVLEKKLRKVPINVPADYIGHFRSASKKNPYDVKYLENTFFKDYSTLKLLTSIRPGNRVGDSAVTDIVALRYSPKGTIEYKLDFSDEWKTLPQRISLRNIGAPVGKLYEGPIPIKVEKFNHLQQLKVVIARDYHSFYDKLKHHCNDTSDPCEHVVPVCSN
jgi:hypothetical protein